MNDMRNKQMSLKELFRMQKIKGSFYRRGKDRKQYCEEIGKIKSSLIAYNEKHFRQYAT